MKNPKSISLKTALYVVLVIFLVVSCKKDPKESKVLAATANDSCECETSWFPHSQTPAPLEGKGSPFDTTSTTNCMFHQWSWQKFLWLTKPDANNNPLFLNQLTQVSDLMIPVAEQTGATIVLGDTEQAGSNGVLKANPAYSGSAADYTVYYSIHSNEVMLSAAKNFKDSLNAGTLPANNLRTFPIGSLELKVSWVDVNTIPAAEQKNFFTTTAAVTTNGNTYTNKTVALLGMHVVGVVINHPEFIWATFQHRDIAPVYDWKKNQANSTTEKLLYTKDTTSGLNGITWIKNVGPKTPLKAFDLFRYGVPLTAGGNFMSTSQQEPMNFNNIQSINDCVAANLDDVWNNYFYNGSLWLNTDGMTPQQQAQKIVDLGYGISSATKGSLARGSVNNANVTMETYTQAFETNITQIDSANLANCFSCHTAVKFNPANPNNPFTSPLYFSHIFTAYLENSDGKTRKQINQLKDKEHELRFVKKTLK